MIIHKVLCFTQMELKKQDSFSLLFNIVLLDINALVPVMLKALQSHLGKKWHLSPPKTSPQPI